MGKFLRALLILAFFFQFSRYSIEVYWAAVESYRLVVYSLLCLSGALMLLGYELWRPEREPT